jgi:hypothetical protein
MLMCCHVDRVCADGLAPCIDRGRAYDWVKHCRMSVYTKTLVILRGLAGDAGRRPCTEGPLSIIAHLRLRAY